MDGQDITLMDLTRRLRSSQQATKLCEKSRRRVPASLLPVITHTLQTTFDALFAQDNTPSGVARKKRG